jgi:hypothetical protein
MLTTKQAAKYLGISYNWFRNMRHELIGPPGVRVKTARGLSYFYHLETLDEFKKTHKWRKPREST